MIVREQFRFWAIGIVVFGVVLYFLSGIMLPFVAGMAVAYFLDPAADRLEAWGLSRTAATTVITVIFFIVVVLFVLLLAPVIYQQFLGYIHRLPGYVEKTRETLKPLVESLLSIAGAKGAVDIKGAVSNYGQEMIQWVGNLLQRLLSGGFAIANLLSLLFITPVVAFYLLRDWDVLVQRVDGWLPRRYAPLIRDLLSEVNNVLAGFARGQAIVCLVLATYYGLALSLVGLEFGLVIGVVSGLISFVPFVGALFGFIASMGVAVVQYWPQYLPIFGVLAVYLVGQVMEGHILTPRLVGRRVGLHPVWVIFGLLAGGALFGFVGVLIAVPLTAVVGVLVRFSLDQYLASGYYRDSVSADGLDPQGKPPSDGEG